MFDAHFDLASIETSYAFPRLLKISAKIRFNESLWINQFFFLNTVPILSSHKKYAYLNNRR